MESGKGGKDICCICLEERKQDGIRCSIKCAGEFCPSCIHVWMQTSGNRICPHCKTGELPKLFNCHGCKQPKSNVTSCDYFCGCILCTECIDKLDRDKAHYSNCPKCKREEAFDPHDCEFDSCDFKNTWYCEICVFEREQI